MRRAWAEASRNDAVREAAAGWKAAGAIDAATLSAIENAYPVTRVVLHKVWRILIFVLVSISIGALFFGIFRFRGGLVGPSLVFGIGLAAATEFLRGSRHSGTGADGATAFWSAAYLLTAFAVFLTDDLHIGPSQGITFLLAASAALGLLAAWRWGFWFFAAAGVLCLFLWVGRLTASRLSWIGLSVVALVFLFRVRDSAAISPAHRRCLAAAFAVSAAALYAAVNLYALDKLLLERLRVTLPWEAQAVFPSAVRWACAAATAAYPVVFLLWGIRTRRTLLLAIALVSGALSVATLRWYVPIGPRWAYLTTCGAFLVAATLWIHRRLRDAPGGAIRGLTASPLYSDDEGGVSPLSALGAGFAASPSPAPADRGLSTGGGEFGGGGASGQY